MKRRIKISLRVFVIFVSSLMILGLFSAVSFDNTGSHSIISGNSNPVHIEVRKASQMSYTPTKLSPSTTQSNQINVFQHYSKEPAPMGIADYGIGYNNVPYSYNTTSFLGIVHINSIHTDNNSLSTPADMTLQLNVNMVFNDGSTKYVYWVQDVAFLNTSSGNHLVDFIDNIWNISSVNANMHNSTILGNGTIGNSSGSGYYFDFANSSLPGNNIVLQYPTNIEFKIVSIITSNNKPEVAFMYNDGYGWITYDNVQFKFVDDLTSDYGFVVNGHSYEPDGYSYYDAELILGGPGGGTQTYDTSSNVQLQLEYWNGHNFQQIVNAFNFGSDTAEGIENVMDSGMFYTNNGTLFAKVTNGNSSLEQIYNQKSIGIINLSSNLQSGELLVNGTPYRFVNDDVNVTLAPGYYNLKLYNSNGFLVAQGNFSLNASEYLPLVTSASVYTVTFNESGLPSGAWYVNLSSGMDSGPITGSSYSFQLTNGTYSYTIATSNKIYEPSAYSGSFTVNGASVSESVTFSKVLYTVTFTETGLQSGTSWSVTLNGTTESSTSGTITFSVPNGTYSYTIATSDRTYEPSASSGSLTANGKNQIISVAFTEVKYTVTFKETGLQSGTTWYVNLSNGQKFSSTTDVISFSEPNGTYSYTIGNISGYSVSSSSGSISVNGASVSKTVSFTPINKSTPPSGIASTELYGIIGVIAAIAVIGSVLVIMRKKR